MQTPRLIFHSKSSHQQFSLPHMVSGLQDLGLISGEMEESDCYFAGPQFIELLTFLGCSPVIKLGPEDGERYCYVEFIQTERAQLIYGNQPFNPRCGSCRQAIKEWLHKLDLQADTLSCPHCNQLQQLERVNWKQNAGFASQFIVIHNIFMHEAVPGEKLLTSMEQLSGNIDWKYFYTL